jgi:hypothetical protein
MANTLDILRDRLRAAGTVGISDTLAYQIVDYVQRMINARYARVVSNSDITLDANTLVFDIRTKLSSATNLISIVISNRTIPKAPTWKEFVQYDRDWYTRTGTRHEMWAQVGFDKFIVYPAKTTNTTATVYYAKATDTIDDDTDDFEIPGEDERTLYDICELIFHVHMRNFEEVKNKVKNIQEDLIAGFPGSSMLRRFVNDQDRIDQLSKQLGSR